MELHLKFKKGKKKEKKKMRDKHWKSFNQHLKTFKTRYVYMCTFSDNSMSHNQKTGKRFNKKCHTQKKKTH